MLSLVARGFGNKEIGDVLGTASGTVKAHVQSILRKARRQGSYARRHYCAAAWNYSPAFTGAGGIDSQWLISLLAQAARSSSSP